MDRNQSTASVKPSTAITHPIWDLVTKVAAPLTIAVAAACYVSGFSYRGFLMPSFGLSSNSIDPSIQATVASGYIAIWSLVFRHSVASLVTLLVWIAFWLVWRIPAQNRFVKVMDAITGGMQLGATILVVLIIGLLAGESAATRDIFKINAAIQTDCRTSCRHYVLRSGSFWGVTVAGDKDKIFVATRLGLRIVRLDSISRIEGRLANQYTEAPVTTLL